MRTSGKEAAQDAKKFRNGLGPASEDISAPVISYGAMNINSLDKHERGVLT